MGHVRPCRYHREIGDDRPRHRLACHLDGLARQMARTAQRAHGRTARPAHAGELPDALSGPRAAPQRHQPDRVSDAGGRKRDPAFREPARRRPQGAHRLAARAHRAGGQPQNGARHRVLATIGSTAPFVGLFGTVWGIMDSFIGISRRTPPTSPWWRRASPKRCSRPRVQTIWFDPHLADRTVPRSHASYPPPTFWRATFPAGSILSTSTGRSAGLALVDRWEPRGLNEMLPNLWLRGGSGRRASSPVPT